VEELLKLLRDNSKFDTGDLAKMFGMTKEELEEKITELEKKGVIVEYQTLINWEKTDIDYVSALIDVKVAPQRGVGFDDIAERIYRFPEVRSVALMSGAYDLSVTVEGRSMKEVALFVAEKLATLEHVQSTTTHFVLKRYKQNGVILEDKQENGKRLVVSP
jgi:DNA-binding Lrp family transcriptional regulator